MLKILALALVLAIPVAGVHAAPAKGKAEKRAAPATAAPSKEEAFLAAHEAFRVGNTAALAQAAAGLKGYVLEPYVEYWQLRVRLEQAGPGEVSDFLGRHTGSYVAEMLRRDWLMTLGKRQDWTLFDASFPNLVIADADTTCYNLQSRWSKGDQTAAQEMQRFWMAPRALPDGCAAIAEAQLAERRMSDGHVWERSRVLVEAGLLSAAKRTMVYLPDGEAVDARALDAMNANPLKFFERADKSGFKKRRNRELVLFAVARAARNDPASAASAWAKVPQADFPAADQAYAWGQLALNAAKRHMPEALEWYAKADSVVLSEESQEWRVRAALRAEDWPAVRDAIERMDPVLRDDPTWVYWRSRALRAAGEREAADQLLTSIADRHNFYGKLAREELGVPLAIPERGYAPTREDIAEAAANPGLRRALALFRLDLRLDGVREWNWSIRGMDDRQLLAAAEVALRAEAWDRAINTADRTQGLHDFSVRFLAPYREVFVEQARSQGLEDALVLGLVRQESRFIPSVRSSAGAAGLMQLMPATAKWMAKKIGMKDFRWSDVTDVDTNIALGTGYLRYVLDELDSSPVLAAAAYNAGPGRARRWKADRPLEGAIYAETIPFNETRDYVKKVMSNTMYYAAMYGGDPRPLKARLGTIPPRVTGEGTANTITGQATVQ